MNPTEQYEWNMQKHDVILRLTRFTAGTPYYAAIACDPDTGIILSDIFYESEDMQKNYESAVAWNRKHAETQFTVTILGGDING